jgi:hypothetical protein
MAQTLGKASVSRSEVWSDLKRWLNLSLLDVVTMSGTHFMGFGEVVESSLIRSAIGTLTESMIYFWWIYGRKGIGEHSNNDPCKQVK